MIYGGNISLPHVSLVYESKDLMRIIAILGDGVSFKD